MGRIRKAVCIAIFIFLCPALSLISMAQDSSLGVIKGRVVNKTLGGRGVEGLEITLHRYAEGKELEIRRTKTDRTGSFSFQGIDVDENRVYYTSTKYKEVEYQSPASDFGKKRVLPLDLGVYETTDQDKDVYVKMHHIFSEIEKGSLWINELMIVENRGDRVYVGSRELEPGKRETLKVSLPREAANVQYSDPLMSCCIVKTEEGFSDSMDIKPGIKRIAFSYTVNYGGSNYQFTKNIHLRTSNIDFFFPDRGIEAKSDQLEFKGSMGDTGKRFSHLSGKNFPPGSRIVVEFGRLPWMRNVFKWVVVGLVILLIAVGFVIPFIRRGRYQKSEEKEGERTLKLKRMDLTEERRAGLQALAELDDLSESGGINPEEYQMKRALLLEKATDITKQLKLSPHKEFT